LVLDLAARSVVVLLMSLFAARDSSANLFSLAAGIPGLVLD
jgi:hypothetical protein